MLSTLRQNWAALLIVLAVPASVVLSHRDTAATNNTTRDTLVSGCVSNSGRTALNAAGWRIAAQTRRDAQDTLPAMRYDAIADGIVARIPTPQGLTSEQDIAEVSLVQQPHVKSEYVLTRRAAVLQRAGCEALYKGR